MPSDARILREGGVEALRAHWAEKSRRRYHRLIDADPDGTHALWRERAVRYYERHGRRLRRCRRCDEPAPATLSIQGSYVCGACRKRCVCGKAIQPKRKYCSIACYTATTRRNTQIGKSCPIHLLICDFCGDAFTSRSKQRKYCSSPCQKEAHITYNREVQRRSHSIAIRYWQYDQSDEAQALASQYFQLRQALRRIRRGNQA